MLDYPALAVINAIIREGSFERAALALGITPSAVSQRVRSLEDRLGTILIQRGQPCTATETGRRLSAHFDRVRLLEHDIVLDIPHATPAPTLPIAVNADSLASWFHRAAATFGQTSTATLDMILDDEAHTADRLRAGTVLAAITADPTTLQGCKTTPLGALRYAACASPDFIARHFTQGIARETLARAPHLRFDRRDNLQARWAHEAHACNLPGPTHWVPSTHAFLDLTLAGLGWAMHPVPMVAPALRSGRLVELSPTLRIDVNLFWTATRLHTATLDHLTRAVLAAAACELERLT